ncbi:heparinase II/III family protein [Rhodobacteraceae bacterium N5(2021)]|uniref:Heparinase II/III family protein n=1 Tax=Gymnodinialimonas phycosphaerae TaxID=2841589 RepID=A0A975YER6_9RHOB|nr:heparinase II/III family protein [Gymnodinialimonas phycosphaerae]MBY4893959.1 heparinase II/III family protein [Gymnodinialimonas phycosphaerae]
MQGFLWQPEPRFPGSAVRGRQLMAGNFRLGGTLVEAEGLSPWDITPPNDDFEAALHGFAWLDDLAALPNGEGRATAQLWLAQWVARYGKGMGPGWSADLTGRRQIRWITHALFLINGQRPPETRLFHHALSRQTNFLVKRWRRATPGLPRFEALTGLIYATCALIGMEARLDPALKGLAQECATQIDAQGGIVTRNPEELLEVFVLLTWIAQIMAETGKQADPAVDTAILRIAPTLRALRHADGSLVRAHGGGRSAPGRLIGALVQSGVRPSRIKGLAMGYARMASGRVTVITDAAPPMIGPGSTNAHAGTLSFEMASANHPLIVNAGSGAAFGPAWRRAGRATVSHSTVSLEGYSSSRFAQKGADVPPERQGFDEGPSDVSVQVSEITGGEGLILSHDGWRRTHGLVHLRSLTLEDNGNLLRGEDGLAALDGNDRDRFTRVNRNLPSDVGLRFAARFHLHPDVVVEVDMGGAAISLTLPTEEVWVFRHGGEATLEVMPSVYFDATRLKPRATKQIVLTSRVRGYGAAVSWSIARPSALLPAPDLSL